MLLMRIIVPLLVVGLMSLSAGVALGDSDGEGGNATSTDDGLATSTDDGLATSTDDGLATSTDDGLATSTDDGLATSTDDGLATSTDDGLATSTDDGMATSTDDGTGGDGERRKAFVGVISGFATSTVGYSITLTQKGTKELVSIYLGGDEVQYKYPGGPNAWDSLEDAITGGAEFVILTRRTDDGNDAIFVLVKPKRPSYVPLVATVIGTEDGVITLVLPNGKTKKVKKPKGDEDPEDGEVLTVIVENTGDGDGEGDADADGEVAEASGLVKASNVAERIQSFIERLAAQDAKLPQVAIDNRQRLVENLAAVLEQHSAQNVSIIERASKAQGLGSGTAAGIQRALEKAQAGQAKGKAIADAAKSKLGIANGAGNNGKGQSGSGSSNAGDDDEDGGSSQGSGKPSDKGKPLSAGSQGANNGNKNK